MKPFIYAVFFFVLISNIAIGQSRCDQMSDSAQTFMIVEELPEANLTDDQIVNLLNSQIALINYGLKAIETVYYTVMVNCKGEAFDYKIPRTIDPDLDSKILQVLESSLTWTPGKQRGNPVDVRLTKRIYIVDYQFQLLTDKQLKKLRKRKNKLK